MNKGQLRPQLISVSPEPSHDGSACKEKYPGVEWEPTDSCLGEEGLMPQWVGRHLGGKIVGHERSSPLRTDTSTPRTGA